MLKSIDFTEWLFTEELDNLFHLIALVNEDLEGHVRNDFNREFNRLLGHDGEPLEGNWYNIIVGAAARLVAGGGRNQRTLDIAGEVAAEIIQDLEKHGTFYISMLPNIEKRDVKQVSNQFAAGAARIAMRRVRNSQAGTGKFGSRVGGKTATHIGSMVSDTGKNTFDAEDKANNKDDSSLLTQAIEVELQKMAREEKNAASRRRIESSIEVFRARVADPTGELVTLDQLAERFPEVSRATISRMIKDIKKATAVVFHRNNYGHLIAGMHNRLDRQDAASAGAEEVA